MEIHTERFSREGFAPIHVKNPGRSIKRVKTGAARPADDLKAVLTNVAVTSDGRGQCCKTSRLIVALLVRGRELVPLAVEECYKRQTSVNKRSKAAKISQIDEPLSAFEAFIQGEYWPRCHETHRQIILLPSADGTEPIYENNMSSLVR